ncbi:hypothetical protein DPMN_170926 [Dreissena polymorpha]|uniref:Uncharacterized protein n=1 Tax=Dreissena polymorpha TaxID=45954 RepID=A0A9D4E0R5_DREPO|nr:hypothetical protein DPMN_170926 [Dreissena polymorpha]
MVISVSCHHNKIIPKCKNGSVTIVTADYHLLVATLFKLGTEISNLSSAACYPNRLDIFDGDSSDISKMLSDKGGSAAANFPPKLFSCRSVTPSRFVCRRHATGLHTESWNWS